MTSIGSPQVRVTATGGRTRGGTRRWPRGPAAASPVAAYYPLGVGNRWQYVTTNTFATESGCDVTQSLEEEEVLEICPGEWGDIRAVIGHHLQLDGHVQSFQTRLWQNGQETADPETCSIFLQVPLKPGARWSWVDENSNLHVAQVSGPEAVKVPAGVFPACLRVRASFRTPEGGIAGNRMDWYAPRVGRVKSILRHQWQGRGRYEEVRELVRASCALSHPS